MAVRKSLRSGSWINYPDYCRPAYRNDFIRCDYNSYIVGFRIVIKEERNGST